MMRSTVARAIPTLLLAWTCSTFAQAASSDETTRSIGTEGTYYLRTANANMEVTPVDRSTPILLRIADLVQQDNAWIYELRYIGMYAGDYDLLDYLRNADGTNLDPSLSATVSIISVLPPEDTGELKTIAAPSLPSALPYRILLTLAALLWCVPLVWWLKSFWTNAPDAESVTQPPTLSLADQLRPLVDKVLSGAGSSREKARLERLLVHFWRERLEFGALTPQQALTRLRADDEAGGLLRQVDQWLHEPPGRTHTDVEALLKPYRMEPEMEQAQ